MDPAQSAADVAYGRQVLDTETAAIKGLVPLLDERFARAVEMVHVLHARRGQVVVTGVGKSGLIGQKVSATLASTGTPSIFMNANEAVHGDLGRVREGDVVLAMSYTGTTSEVVRLVPALKKIGASLVAITATPDSPLGKAADVALTVGNVAEACPIGLAPTSSTTAMLAMGDALAMTVAHRKKFNREDFALFHPGGSLGRKLVKVGEVMRSAAEATIVRGQTRVRDAFAEMSKPRVGRRASAAILVVDDGGRLEGIFTDGDFRRSVLADAGVLDAPIASVMTHSPKVARKDELLAEAYKRLKDHEIDELPVVDDAGRAVGILDVQDALEWGTAF
jgi:arabinose-5-phosphate isomerase